MSGAFPYFPPKSGRVHEVFGPGAHAFAAVFSAMLSGNVLWVRATHRSETIHPLGLMPFADPARLLSANVANQIDGLAVAEEALRDGAIPLVVVEITKALSLTAGRRLQLAAKAGGTTGLCLIPEGMGSNAAETRWHAAPVYDPKGEDSTLFQWSLKKNKSGTNGSWHVRWDHATRRLNVVSPPGK